MRRLSVLHVITDLDVGGAESMLAQLVDVRSTPELNHQVVSIMPDGALAPAIAAGGVPVSSIRGNPPRRAPGAILRLASLIRLHRPDVVQGWLYHGDLAATLGLLASLRRGRTRLCWGIRCSEMDLKLYGTGFRAVVKACTALSAVPEVIVANSSIGQAVHQRLGYRARRWVVIPNGVDVARFKPDPAARRDARQALGLDANARVVAHVARVDPMKDHASFLAAMRGLPEVTALLVGAGTDKLVLPPNVRALGRRADVQALLAACDLVASSSAFGEGFSNVLAEGMACGLPAVATDVGDARLIVGETGRIVPPRAPAALAQAIRDLFAETPEQLAMRGAAARARIADSFSLDRAAVRFAELYHQLVDGALS